MLPEEARKYRSSWKLLGWMSQSQGSGWDGVRSDLGHDPSLLTRFWNLWCLCREVGEEYMGQCSREGRGVTQECGFCFGVGFVS